jgi:hypothetical protein
MAFMGGALGIDDKRRGRHQWDMPLLEYLQSTEVSMFISITALNFINSPPLA